VLFKKPPIEPNEKSKKMYDLLNKEIERRKVPKREFKMNHYQFETD
tara:strand:+ start:211 stop:348 length:138 start_codon:yes stop_codon:yes gene_type:complete